MKIALVCSAGGHLTQMLELADELSDHDTFLVSYDSPRTRKLQRTHIVPSFADKGWMIVPSFMRMFSIMVHERPDVILSTGSEIAIPAFICGKLSGAKTIFVESAARITSTSMTGRILYPISDFFFVQWPNLKDRIGKRAIYRGGLL